MKDRVLVTGGAGFIGSHTVDLLLEKGYQVRVLDSLQPRVHPLGKPDYLPAAVDFRQGEVQNPADLLPALEGVDSVLHLAAYQDYMPDFSRFLHINAESTALLYELILGRGLPVRKVVVAASQAVAGEGKYRCPGHGVVYPGPRPLAQLERGDWESRCPECGSCLDPLPIDERTSNPHTAYGISKYAVELLALNLGRRYGIPSTSVRYTYVQGPRNSFYNAYSGICRIFALRILNGLPPVVYEDGMQLRDFIDVSDVARANVLLMESPEADYRVFNVGPGRAVTVLDFARLVLRVAGSSLEPVISGQFRVGDTRHTVSDITALRALGWSAEVPLERTVERYIEWIRPFQDTRGYLDAAEAAMRGLNVIKESQRSEGHT
ncbi:MAG TPA: NAD-dependent epimerase/dehydratase family protein [Bryobacteraceae bacterium]|jgi:dTDP-L-rhamnose 4-epimerase|nr:NAD-dependent epimerase/dehydratase family protein [Bryobacteraceae bacterium]